MYKKYGTYSLNINLDTPNMQSVIDSNTFSTPINHYFYFQVNTYITKIDKGYIILGEIYNSERNAFVLSGLSGIYPPTPSNSKTWLRYSALSKNVSKYNSSIYRIGIFSESSSISGVGNVYFDGIIFVDLTATFGSGNEPDKDWCDKHIQYFDGTTTIYK